MILYARTTRGSWKAFVGHASLDPDCPRLAHLALPARLPGHHSELRDRQLNAPMTAPIVSASQSCQLDSRNGTKS